jgi:hypothetical protein
MISTAVRSCALRGNHQQQPEHDQDDVARQLGADAAIIHPRDHPPPILADGRA